MSILTLLIIGVVICFALWALPQVIPMDQKAWTIVRAGVLLLLVIVVLYALLGGGGIRLLP